MYRYEAVVAQLRQAILQQYAPGDKLPSIRQLSQTLACNKQTIQTALRVLKEEGLLYVRPKSGYYVLKRGVDALPPHSSSVVSPVPFPLADFELCLQEALRQSQRLDTEGELAGYPPLLEAMRDLLETYGVYTTTDELVITTGTQQALYLLLATM